MLRHVEDSSLGMCTHAAHAVGGGGDRRKSCATESRSTTCMIPPQRGHFHSGRFEGVPDEAVTAAGLSESWLLEQLETQGKELRSPAVRQEAKDVQTSLLPNDGRISEASSRSRIMAFSSTYTRKQQEHSPKYYCRKPELSELRTRKFGWACGREQRSLKESEGPRLVPLPTLESQSNSSAL